MISGLNQYFIFSLDPDMMSRFRIHYDRVQKNKKFIIKKREI